MTKNERLRLARSNAGFASASAGALAVGVTTSTYIHHENGTRDFDEQKALIYGKYFSVDPSWILFGDREPDRKPSALPDGNRYDYGTHECLDRTYLVMEMFSYVSEHPQVKANPQWTEMAEKAHHALWELYQAIGATSGDEAKEGA
ncbi:hypothetical protein A6U86_05720 [Rhizobium sp. AC27/96]|uniref:helix-turn-helix domain-containing protein n=1 Tax=Rhizobium sp. AC27/96 TaxID=1841653 RepID=UPI000829088E|nr:helix-turn-helix transcriptional regulator [Rhizobium sp. AC27/96]OCJ12520.1 hypothetical protein A6U86_05720 [Rhizobium sp. AC27/96]